MNRRLQSTSRTRLGGTVVRLWVVLLLLFVTPFVTLALPRFQTLSSLVRSKKYTPLVFFTVPKGLLPECDAMERVVTEMEQELGVRVERLDILRQPAAEAILATLTQRSPPFLYHRESCQIIHIPSTSTTSSKNNDGSSKAPIYIDKARVRAWAKGRYLAPIMSTTSSTSTTKVHKPKVLSQQDDSIDQEELLEDMMLTPLQREGKKRIKERTDAKAKQD